VLALQKRLRAERDRRKAVEAALGKKPRPAACQAAKGGRAATASAGVLDAIMHHLPACVALIRGSDLRVMMVNPAYQALAPAKEMLDRTLDEVWPETGQDFASICRRVLDTGRPHGVTDELNMIIRRPGAPPEPAYFTWSLHRVALPDNQGWGLLNVAGETTARKQAENALEQERDRLRALINSIQDEVWFADVAGRFALVNPAGSSHFRLESRTSADVRSLARSLEVFRPDGTPRPIEGAPPLRALRGEIVTNEEEMVRTPATGELRHRQVSAAPVRDAAGNIIGSVSVVRDITDLKRGQEAQRQLAQFPEQNPNPVLRIGHDGSLMYANGPARAWLATYGWAEGAPLPPQIMAVASEAQAVPGAHQAEIDQPGGGVFWFSAVRPEGETYVNLYAREVTARRRAEEQIHRQIDELRIVNEELSRFNRVAVGRELRMIELKKEINAMCQQAGKPTPYRVDAEEATP
jgi:two-component system CheB/CheR fusion protein